MNKPCVSNAKLQYLPVKELELSNTNPRQSFGIEQMNDLTNSIKEKGIIQPLLVRRINPNKYEVVCGNRRLTASRLIELDSVPCMIKELSNDDVVQVQIIENLQREDVHPLEEAKAYAHLLSFENTSIDTIADSIGKSKKYVTNRLQLNHLIDDFKKLMLLEPSFTISHALLVCKLLEDKQTLLLDDIRDWEDKIITVNELKDSIEVYLKNNSLDEVGFDLSDNTLLDDVPSCVDCSKKSGAQPVLFSEFETGNTCLDNTCLELKKRVHFMRILNKCLENDETLSFLDYSNDVPKRIVERITKEHDKKIISYINDVQSLSSEYKDDFLKVFVLNGNKQGSFMYVKLHSKNVMNEKKKMDELSPAEKIERIEQREIRSKELDQEKIHSRISETLGNHNSFLKRNKLKANGYDEFLSKLTILNTADYYLREEIKEKFKLEYLWQNDSKIEYVIKEVKKLNANDMAYIIRRITFQNYKNSNPVSFEGKTLRRLAEQFQDLSISDIEEHQLNIADKRQKRINERVKELKNRIK